MTIVAGLMLAGAVLRSTPALGIAEGRCRPHEPGPSLLIAVVGLKDRVGLLRAEVYPDNDRDFLADDNVLVAAGKTFRRTVSAIPADGPVQLCIRLPTTGNYSLSVSHNRDGGRRFNLLRDGIGFGSNPKLGLSKPKAAAARVMVAGITRVSVVMNYRIGLFSFGPLTR